MIMKKQEKDFREGDGLKMNMKDSFKPFIFMDEIGQKYKTMCEPDPQLKQDLMLRNTFKNLIEEGEYTKMKVRRMKMVKKELIK